MGWRQPVVTASTVIVPALAGKFTGVFVRAERRLVANGTAGARILGLSALIGRTGRVAGKHDRCPSLPPAPRQAALG